MTLVQYRHDVFFSYCRVDRATVESVAARLTGRYIRVWLDAWQLKPGDNWQQPIENALLDSRACAVFIGGDKRDRWCLKKTQYAVELAQNCPEFRVFAVLLAGADDDHVPWTLRAHHHADLRESSRAEGELERLAETLRQPGSPSLTDAAACRRSAICGP